MGYYINPRNSKKEDWLEENGTRVTGALPLWNEISKEDCIVCLINNGPFTAAGVCYKEGEFQEFKDPTDHRFKMWYIVNKELVVANSDIAMGQFQ